MSFLTKPTIKLKAFTLMELAIGMLLTSITVAAGFSLYLAFIKTIKKHTEQKQQVKEMQALYFTMENDLEKAYKILKTENGIAFYTADESQAILYHLEDTLLIREIPSISSDTFKLNTEEIIFDPLNEDGNDPLIRHFAISLNWNKSELIYHWKKSYSPVESINQYILEEHGH